MRKTSAIQWLVLLVLVLPFFWVSGVSGQGNTGSKDPFLILRDGQGQYLIGQNISYLEDPSKSLGIREVTSNDYARRFQASNQDSLNFGLKDSAYWVRITVRNESASDEWILELSRPSMNSVFFYTPGPDGYSEIKTGYVYPFSTRDIPHEDFLFDLNITPGQEKTYYLRAEDMSLDLPLWVWSHEEFIQHDQITRLILSLSFGALAIMLIYNLVLLLIMKEVGYVYYALFQFFLLMFLGSLQGYAPRFLWPGFPLLNFYIIPLSLELLVMFLMLFTWDFLRFEGRPKWVDLFKSAVIAALIFGIFVTFFIGAKVLLIVIPASILLILCTFLLSNWAFVKGFKPARYYLFAWSVFLLIGAIMILHSMGVITLSHLIPETALELGSVYLVIFQSFALTDRINYFKQEHLNAQSLLIQKQKETLSLKDQLNAALETTREELERNVSERTSELLDLNKKLSEEISERIKVESELKKLASIDFLTGLFNRRHFFDIAQTEFQRAKRYNKPLAVIIFDIDHFKGVNDSFGHLVGDQALVQISRLIQEIIRKTDVAARYGGEEFVILLPENNLESALLFAERLRGLVESSPILSQDEKIHLTVSIGVAGVDDASHAESFDHLISSADQNLYKAKNLGRNQVIG